MKHQNVLTKITDLQKKVEKLRPLDKLQIIELRNYYKIGLTWSSNALEGNSLTETETKVAIEEGLTAAGKPLRDYYEAIGHAQAYDFLYEMAKSESFDELQIKRLHHLFYKKNDDELAGKYREVRVFISGSRYLTPNPELVPAKSLPSEDISESTYLSSSPIFFLFQILDSSS